MSITIKCVYIVDVAHEFICAYGTLGFLNVSIIMFVSLSCLSTVSMSFCDPVVLNEYMDIWVKMPFSFHSAKGA